MISNQKENASVSFLGRN